MTTHDVVDKYQARLNKSDSQDYDNLWWYQIEETFYKGMLAVIRRMKKGINAKQEGDEETTDSMDDLQSLLKRTSLNFTSKDLYVESSKLPKDYLYYKRLSPKCSKGNCQEVRIKSFLREEANVDDLLIDDLSQPSFDFEQTFHTLSGNKFSVYHNKDFKVDSLELTYYRLPTKYPFEKGREVLIDFKDDLVDLFVDEGISIMSGDIQDYNTKSVSENNNSRNI